jgi:hypothetical protein
MVCSGRLTSEIAIWIQMWLKNIRWDFQLLGPISSKNHPELKMATSMRPVSFPAFQSGHWHCH